MNSRRSFLKTLCGAVVAASVQLRMTDPTSVVKTINFAEIYSITVQRFVAQFNLNLEEAKEAMYNLKLK